MNGDGVGNLILEEVLRDSHRYSPGVEQHQQSEAYPPLTARRRLTLAREYARDAIERAAGRAGFSRRHFDARRSGSRLRELSTMLDGLDATGQMLADEPSRRQLVDLMKLRVLGPYHVDLRVTPAAYRAKQRYADAALRLKHGTYQVSDPFFSPLSLYEVAVPGHAPVRLHSHSVDVVSVFLLEQYAYSRGPARVSAGLGDVVLDVGGCWGDTALYFASLVGEHGKVYAFEFNPENLEIFRANLALNPGLADRIEIVERALWSRSGESLSFVSAGRMTTVGEPTEVSQLAVETVTLDDFVASAGIDRVGYVKMDVEGAEMDVLRGARGTLKAHAPGLALAAYHKPDDLVQLPGELSDLDVDYGLYLDTFSAGEDETVLFASSMRRN